MPAVSSLLPASLPPSILLPLPHRPALTITVLPSLTVSTLQYHERLEDKTDDQLSLASIHYLRSHFQEATDIYKKLLMEHREYLALNVYAPATKPHHLPLLLLLAGSIHTCV